MVFITCKGLRFRILCKSNLRENDEVTWCRYADGSSYFQENWNAKLDNKLILPNGIVKKRNITFKPVP
jgi:hypothetical protein